MKPSHTAYHLGNLLLLVELALLLCRCVLVLLVFTAGRVCQQWQQAMAKRVRCQSKCVCMRCYARQGGKQCTGTAADGCHAS